MDFRRIILPLLCTLGMVSCQKRYEYPYPLRLNAKEIELNMYEGESRVVVYSNTSWHAGMVQSKGWCELTGGDGCGIGEFVFNFAQNESIARKASIAIEAGEVRDTVTFVQKGSISTPSFSFKESIVTVDGLAGEYSIPFETNLPDAGDLVIGSVVYYYEGEPLPEINVYDKDTSLPVDKWISAFRFDDGAVVIDVKKNGDGQKRTADFYLLLDNGLDIKYKVSVRLRQSAL